MYQFNRYVTICLWFLVVCAIQDERSLRAFLRVFFKEKFVQSKCSSPRQNAIELNSRYVSVIYYKQLTSIIYAIGPKCSVSCSLLLLWPQVQRYNAIIDNELFRERSWTLWNSTFGGKGSGTLWNIIMGLMEGNNYMAHTTAISCSRRVCCLTSEQYVIITGGHCSRMERQRTLPNHDGLSEKRAHQLHWTSHVASK